jgi:hypothetical protein
LGRIINKIGMAVPYLFYYPSYRLETSQTMIPMGMAIQVIKNQKANNVSVTGTSTMYITVPIHNQKNQRVIFYFAIGRSLEDHPRSTNMVEIIVGNPGLLTLLSPLG